MDQLWQNSSSSGAPMADTTPAFQPPPPGERNRRRHQTTGNDTEVEVIALPVELLSGQNMFSCDICNKGFSREQNLKLHKRGHNIPCTFKNKSKEKADKIKVYVCPEPDCPNHDPSEGLIELTSIKKHYKRRHGEKNLMCSKCDKTYSVQSDLNAHMKICGTKEYKCACGCVFFRRDSFFTHQTLCEGLVTQQSTNLVLPVIGNSFPTTYSSFRPPTFPDSAYMLSSIPSLNTNTMYFSSNTTQAGSYSSNIFSNQPDFGTGSNKTDVHSQQFTDYNVGQQSNDNIGHTAPDDMNIFDIDFLYERLCAAPSANMPPPAWLQPAPRLASLSTNPISTSTSSLRSFGSSTAADSVLGGIEQLSWPHQH